MDEKRIKLPKSLAACADLLFKVTKERLKLQAQAEALGKIEGALEEHFINTLPKSQASGISGQVAHVQLKVKAIPVVNDWDALYKFIAKEKAWELLQRRLNQRSATERAEAGKPVPGVGNFNKVSVSCTAVKK